MSLVRMSNPRPREAYQTVNLEPSKTVQSDADRADMRKILAKYEQTGVLVNMAKVDLTYRDVSEFSDFSELMLHAKEAESAFMRLPSKVREVFGHDVMKWLDGAHDGLSQEQVDKLTVLGVLPAVEDPAKPSGTPAAEGVEPKA